MGRSPSPVSGPWDLPSLRVPSGSDPRPPPTRLVVHHPPHVDQTYLSNVVITRDLTGSLLRSTPDVGPEP